MKTQGINKKLTGLWSVGLSVALGVTMADARPGERGAPGGGEGHPHTKDGRRGDRPDEKRGGERRGPQGDRPEGDRAGPGAKDGEHRGPPRRGMPPEVKKQIMERFDANKDGKLSEEERKAAREGAEQMRKEHREKILGNFDKDGDGELNEEERKALREKHEAAMNERREEMLKRFDANEDGKLDDAERAELRKILQERAGEGRPPWSGRPNKGQDHPPKGKRPGKEGGYDRGGPAAEGEDDPA